jgi:thiamine biosynthesis lipoprotein
MMQAMKVAAGWEKGPAKMPDEWPLHEFYAMGSHMSVRLAVPPGAAAGHFQRVVELFARAEECLSRFRPESELSLLNAAAGSWRKVSPMIWEMTGRALAMAAVTGGLFDPTLLVALQASGYDRDFAEVAARGATPLSSPGQSAPKGRWQEILRRPCRREIFIPAGVGLDFGGIAKALMAEEAVARLRSVGPCLIDAGGDLAAGDAPAGWPGWPVAIAAPSGVAVNDAPPYRAASDNPQDLAMVWLRNATLVTSGIDYRRWPVAQGQEWAHHIIDPRTGRPSTTDLVSVSLLASQAAQAEAWAKAA